LWPANSTQPFTGTAGVYTMDVCLPGSGAITSFEYSFCPEDGQPTPPPTPAPTPCKIVQCDFNTLAVGVPLTDFDQVAALEIDCLLSVTITNTIRNNVGNIFDSSKVLGDSPAFDTDLASPNRNCPGGGPGRGSGGKPGAPFPNCEPLGNLLIIQNEDKDPSEPNDSRFGGCFVFQFVQPVNLLNFGIVDVDEGVVTITITSTTAGMQTFDSPSNIGDNGHWKAALTKDLSDFVNVVVMEICFPGSGAVSFIDVNPCDSFPV
jgi:hypothetical protein